MHTVSEALKQGSDNTRWLEYEDGQSKYGEAAHDLEPLYEQLGDFEKSSESTLNHIINYHWAAMTCETDYVWFMEMMEERAL